MKKLFTLLLIGCFAFVTNSFGGLKTATTGNWNPTAGSNTAFASVTTTVSDSIKIPRGVTVTVTGIVTCGALYIEETDGITAAGAIIFSSSASRQVLVVGGTAGNAGTITANGPVTMNNSGSSYFAWNGPAFRVGAGIVWTWGGSNTSNDGGLHYTGTTVTTLFGNGSTIGTLWVTAAGGTVNISGDVNLKAQGTGASNGSINLGTSTSNVIIQTGSTVTTSSVAAAANDFVITSGGKITLNGTAVLDNKSGTTATLVGAGAITLNGTSKYIHDHTGTTLQGAVAGTVVYNTGTTCEIRGYTTGQVPGVSFNQTFYNFNWNCTGQTGTINVASMTGATVNGKFTIVSTNSQILRLNNNTTAFILTTNDFEIQAGTLEFTGSSGATTTKEIFVGGNFTQSGGTITESGSATTRFTFNKTGTQTFTKSAGTISNNVDFVFNSGSIIDFGTNILDGSAGVFTLSSGAGLITANTNATGALTASGANGSVQVTGTRTYNVGANYTFNGASAQVAGDGFTGANNLTINNSAGVTLSAATTVTGTLVLTSGMLTLGANNLTLTGATVTGTPTNFIVTNSTGSVLSSIASGGGSFVFPIGRSSSLYNPLTITNTGGSTSVYTVGSATTTYSPSADGAGGQWTIASSASTTSTLAFGWSTTAAGTNLAAAPGSGVTFQYNGSTWDARGGTTATGTPNTTTVTGITNLTNPTWTVALPAATPPTVTTSTVSNIQITTADGGGNVTVEGTSSVTVKGVKYDVSSPATANSTSDGSGAGIYTSSLTGLTANTKYFYRAYATSYTTSFGTELNFTTLPNAPTVGTGTSPTSVGFTANWTAPTGQGAETFTYTVEVSTDNSSPANFTTAIVTTTTGIASGTLSQLYNTLSPGTTYYFRVKAVNTTGSSAYSAISAGITTTSATAPTGVTTGTAGSLVVDGATFTGNNITTDGGDNLTARGLAYKTTPGAETGGTLAPLGGTPVEGSFNQTLSGLASNQVYYVKAYGTNTVGTTYASNEVSFTTLAAEPTTASTVTVPTRTDVTLGVSFTGGDGTRRIVVARQGAAVSFSPTDGSFPAGTISSDFSAATDQGSGNKIVFDGTGTSVSISGLVKNTNYQFAVFEYNNNSASSPNFLSTAGTATATTYNPTITASGTLSFGNQVTGTSSASQPYDVSGTELVSDVTITAPANFQVSTDDIDFSVNPIVLAKNGSDAVPSTTIHVRYSPSAATGATGSLNVSNAATNATTQNVVVSGNAIATEPTAVGTVSFGTIGATSIVINYTLPGSGNGTNRIIVAKAGSAPTGVPSDATVYTANAAFGTGGTALGDGFVVFNGPGSGSPTVTVTGLTGTTHYYFAVYEYNVGTGTSQNYYTTAAVNDATTTDATATTDFFRSNVTTGNWGDASSWQSSHDGSTGWKTADFAPTSAAASVIIQNTHTITIATTTLTIANTTVQDGGNLIVQGVLTVASSKVLTIDVNAGNGGGTLEYQASNNSATSNSPVITSAGGLVVNGNYVINPTTPNNLNTTAPSDGANYIPVTNTTWASTSVLTIKRLPTTDTKLRINGDIGGTVVLDVQNGSDGVSGYNLFNVSAVTFGALTVKATGVSSISQSAGAARNLTVTNNMSVEGGTFSCTGKTTTTGSSLLVSGNLTVSGGTLAVSTSTGTANTGTITVTGTTTVSGGVLTAVTGAAVGASSVTLNGAVSISSGSITGSTSSANSTAAMNIKGSSLTITGGTVTGFTGAGSGATLLTNRAGAQTITASGTYTLGNLTAANTSGGISLASAVTLGSLNISTGTFDVSASNYALNVSGNWINAGTFNPRSGTVTFNGTTTISGASTTSFNNVIISGTLTAPSGSINVAGDWTNNGTFNNGTGTVSFNGNNALQTIAGSSTTGFNVLEVAKSAIGNIADVTSLITTSSVTFTTGALRISSASTVTLGAGSKTISTGAGLILNNAGAVVNNTGGSITLNGSLTVNSGDFNMGTGNNSLVVALSTSTATFSGGTVDILGRLTLTDGTTIINGSAITIDPQATASLAGTVDVFSAAGAANLTFSSGSVTIIDPHATTGSGNAVQIVSGAGAKDFTGSIISLGNGVSATAGTTDGFDINAGVALGSIIVNNPSGTNRSVRLITNDLSLMGSLTITAGTLNTNNLNISLAGNWSNAGTFTPGTSTVTFNGTTGQQQYTRSGTGSFNNLTLSNADGLLLNNSATVGSTLSFTNGSIATGANTLTITSATAVSGAGAGKYVNGNLAYSNLPTTGNPARTFTIGDASVYAPVTVTYTTDLGTGGTLTASTSTGDHAQIATSGLDASSTVNRTWTLTPTGLAGGAYTADLNFAETDKDGGYDFNTGIVKLYNGSWTTTTSTSASLSSQVTAQSAYGDFQIGNTACVPGTWTGSIDNDWTNAGNWSCSTLPTSSSSITISSGTPHITSDFTVGSGGSLAISGTGSLFIDPTATLTIAGSADFGGQPVTVRSTVSGTGAIGQVTGTLTGATNVTVERYIPQNAYRAWRLLSVPTKSSGQTVHQAWQENQGPKVNGVPNYGTLITTSVAANYQSNGFDTITQGGSVRSYNGSAFVSMTTTNTDIETKSGYFLYVRGDRSAPVNIGYNLAGSTTLRTNGTLYQGDNSITGLGSGLYALVGNVYASELDFSGISRTNIDNKFYLWDASLGGTAGGAYRTFLSGSPTGGTYIMSGGGTTAEFPLMTTNPKIPSGQAFFVHSNAAGAAITLSESNKSTGHTNQGFRPAAASKLVMLTTNLYAAGQKNASDGNVVMFDKAYSNAVDVNDADKLTNPGENFGITRDGKTLAIETRQDITSEDVIYFNMKNMEQQDYSLEFSATNMQAGVEAFLEDSYLGTSTAVDLNAGTRLNFTVTADAKSSAANRFKLVFRPTIPVTANGKSFIKVSPNPVQGTNMNIQFSNQPAGRYNILLTDVVGRLVFSSYAQHAGGTATQVLTLPSHIITGAYQVEVIAPDKTKSVEKIIINQK